MIHYKQILTIFKVCFLIKVSIAQIDENRLLFFENEELFSVAKQENKYTKIHDSIPLFNNLSLNDSIKFIESWYDHFNYYKNEIKLTIEKKYCSCSIHSVSKKHSLSNKVRFEQSLEKKIVSEEILPLLQGIDKLNKISDESIYTNENNVTICKNDLQKTTNSPSFKLEKLISTIANNILYKTDVDTNHRIDSIGKDKKVVYNFSSFSYDMTIDGFNVQSTFLPDKKVSRKVLKKITQDSRIDPYFKNVFGNLQLIGCNINKSNQIVLVNLLPLEFSTPKENQLFIKNNFILDCEYLYNNQCRLLVFNIENNRLTFSNIILSRCICNSHQ